MNEDRDASDEKAVLSAELARTSGPYPKGLKLGHSYSDLPDPDGLDPNTNLIPHRPPGGTLLHEQPFPLSPNQSIAPNTNSAISTSVFQGGSDNAVNNSTVTAVNRDLHQGNVYNCNYTTYISYGKQGPSSSQQTPSPPDTPSTSSTLATRTAVTSSYPQDGAPHPMMSNLSATASFPTAHRPDPTALGSQGDNGKATGTTPSQMPEGQETEYGSFEIALLENLDMAQRHRPEAWYRSSEGLSHAEIYIREIYPSAHGYPCPNPCFEGPPVRIGDIGKLNSAGFTAIKNLADCQLPSLQSVLASLALSDPWHKAGYFSEGHSITGGALVDAKRWPVINTIRKIKYRCNAPQQGAILAVTSPAQLHTLPLDRNDRLRDWLRKHGMDLLQFVNPGRTEPLYLVTGKVTSSSWATATYSEPMIAPDDELVLTHHFRAIPPYRWTEPKNARTMSQSSSTVDAQGKIASDQCLFLRGFLLTPSPQYVNCQARHALKTSDNNPGTSESPPNVDGTRGASGEGSSQFTPSVHPSSRGGAAQEGTMGESAWGSKRGDFLMEEVPSLSPLDYYPSHRINRRLLELTDADLAITHDDDWRLRLEGLHRHSLLGIRKDIPASVARSARLNTGKLGSVKLHQSDATASTGKLDEGQAGRIQNFQEVKSTGSTDIVIKGATVHRDGTQGEASQEVQGTTAGLVRNSGAGQTAKPKLHMPSYVSSSAAGQTLSVSASPPAAEWRAACPCSDPECKVDQLAPTLTGLFGYDNNTAIVVLTHIKEVSSLTSIITGLRQAAGGLMLVLETIGTLVAGSLSGSMQLLEDDAPAFTQLASQSIDYFHLLNGLKQLMGDNVAHFNQLASQSLDNFHLLMVCEEIIDESSPLAGNAKDELDKVAKEFSGIMLHIAKSVKALNERGRFPRFIFAKADKNDLEKHRNTMTHMTNKLQIVLQLANLAKPGGARDNKNVKQLTEKDIHNVAENYKDILVQRAEVEYTRWVTKHKVTKQNTITNNMTAPITTKGPNSHVNVSDSFQNNNYSVQNIGNDYSYNANTYNFHGANNVVDNSKHYNTPFNRAYRGY
ncbi:hypothetical protein BKA70DRAFT_1460348 [Coprinopsis sp. MPI-PUGE-AT-0042]|nr:hypothetical protein BKA70DRAFT_1460348 [Coprinopsis sp. MPI-PUGE-AT-0042]